MDWSSDVCSSDLIRAPTFWRPNSSVSASSVAVMIRLKTPFGRNADIFGLLLRQLRQLHAELFKMHRSNLLVEMLGQHINVFLIGVTIGRSEEHTSALQSLMSTSYDGCCLNQQNRRRTRSVL